MDAQHLPFAGWQCLSRRDVEVARQFAFLLRVFTPRTVFMEIGSADCELSLRAATYVERVWCIEAAIGTARPPCNLRLGGMPERVDVAFSESLKDAERIYRALAPQGVYFVYGQLIPAQLFREAGFSRVQYYVGALRVPGALARISRSTTTAVYK
jgi:hypothetical protein